MIASKSLGVVGTKEAVDALSANWKSEDKFKLVGFAENCEAFVFVCDIGNAQQNPFPLDSYYNQISTQHSIQKVSTNYLLFTLKFLGFVIARSFTPLDNAKIRNQRVDEPKDVSNKFSFTFFDETVDFDTISLTISNQLNKLESHPLFTKYFIFTHFLQH